ncbi:MAG: AI-2E family transporter [Ruminococcaceae bacterium]|nr:AI-2E family transporter [Oscillospiraceae bacterium]
MDKNKKSTLKTVLIIFSAILFYTVLQNTDLLSLWISYLGQILAPIFIGIVLAFVINLPLRFFENKVFRRLNQRGGKVWPKIRRGICLTLSVLLLIGIIALVIGLILPEVKNTAVSMLQTLPKHAEQLIENAKGWVEKLNLPIDVTKFFEEIDWNSISKSLLSGISDTGSTVIVTTIDITSEVVGGVFNFVVGFALSLYILGSKERLGRQFSRLLNAMLPKKIYEKISHVFHMSGDIFTGFITGQLTEAVLIGLWCYIGMLIFRMPYAIMVSATISITALIPVFGALIGTGFGALMIFFVSPIKAIGFVVYIVIIQQIDNNVIYPRIMGNSVGLPGIWVLCAVTVGGSLFGAVGMLLSVPVCAVLYCLAKEFVAKREAAKALEKTDTEDAPN